MMIPEKVFKKYDIRAVMHRDLLIEDIYNLGRAIATYCIERDASIKTVVLGMDGRLTSATIKEELTRALLDAGLNVTFIGVCPTPVLYFAAQYHAFKVGIIITASHNPKEYNGLKMVIDNKPVWADDLQVIKDIFLANRFMAHETPGAYTQLPIADVYIDYLYNAFKHLDGVALNAVIDCGNGAAGAILPALCKKFNVKNYTLLFEEIDGNFPNHEPDPSNVEHLQAAITVQQQQAYSYVVAFDGDADRFAVVTPNGKLLSGDQLLAIYATKLASAAKVVFDIKCSTSLVQFLQQRGLTSIFSQTGAAHIKEKMSLLNAGLGGELSGHYCFSDRYFGFDDGIYAMLRFIEIIADDKNAVETILKTYPRMVSEPEIRIQCAAKDLTGIVESIKTDFKHHNFNISDLDGVRLDLDFGWGILRASNTEPVLSMRFEGNSEKELKDIKKIFYNTIAKYFDSPDLRSKLI